MMLMVYLPDPYHLQDLHQDHPAKCHLLGHVRPVPVHVQL
jgi:hypothetical protein